MLCKMWDEIYPFPNFNIYGIIGLDDGAPRIKLLFYSQTSTASLGMEK